MVYQIAKAKRTSNTWFTYIEPVSSYKVGDYDTAESVRKDVMKALKQDVQRVGWKKVSNGELGVGPFNSYNGYLIYKDRAKAMFVYAWSSANPDKGHGYAVYMIKSDTYYELNSNGRLGRQL